MKKHLLLLISFIFAAVVCAQTPHQYKKAANKAYEKKDYYNAFNFYNILYEANGHAEEETCYKLAESARQFNAYALAAEHYAEVAKSDVHKDFPLTNYRLGVMYKYLGKYEEARQAFEKYVSDCTNPTEDKYAIIAQKEIEACIWAPTILNDSIKRMEIELLGEEINTPYSEHAAFKFGDSLLYTSLRFNPFRKENDTTKIISKVLVSFKEKEGQFLTEDFNSPTVHTAHAIFNTDASKIYFTLCKNINTSDLRCQIYYRPLDGNGTMGETVKLPDYINKNGYTSTQPNISFDEEVGREILYFVSDRPAGKGGLDIWYSVIHEDGTFGEPLNFDKANTEEDEITPFYHTPSKTLFFSSLGYKTLGGFDIFKIKKTPKNKWDKVIHGGYPLNSSYNDLSYSTNHDKTEGYLSSNREGTLFLEKEKSACCNDIFRVSRYLVEISLIARTFNGEDQSPLEEVTLQFIDITKSDFPKVIDIATNFEGNEFRYPLKEQRLYQLIATKDNFTSDTIEFSTFDIDEPTIFEEKLFLTPAPEPPIDTLRLQNFKPFALFFNNDEPDNRSLDTITQKDYQELYSNYVLKKSDFIRAFTRGLKGTEKEEADAQMDAFFTNNVQSGFDKLKTFSEVIHRRLRRGRQVTILVKAYTSPRAKTDYNMLLGKRRVSSMINFYKTFKDGALEEYIENGQLEIIQISYGESQVPDGVSDDIKDVRNSVYSIPASRERRVEVLDITAQRTKKNKN